MNDDLKTLLVNEIGLFAYGKGNWLEYSNKMNMCFAEYRLKSNRIKKDICIAAIGGKTLKILKTIIRPHTIQDEEITYDCIIETLERHFYPSPDSTFFINKFNLRKQVPGESFFNYVVALRKLIVNCRFPKKGQHSKLRNQLITGVVEDLKDKLNVNTMSLTQVFEAGILWDDSKTVKVAPRPRNHKARINRVPKCFRCAVPVEKHNDQPCPFDWGYCSSCSIKGHLPLACKYKDFTCNNCQTAGHIAKVCKKAAVAQSAQTVVCTHNVITSQ